MVPLFGDNYQLILVDKKGVISCYDKRCDYIKQHITDEMTKAQLFAYFDDWIFIEIMTDKVYFLTNNYYVSCE